MYNVFAKLLQVITLVQLTRMCWTIHPQVHEEIDHLETSPRSTKFNYHPQVDLTRMRYSQQQLFDSRNKKRHFNPFNKREIGMQHINFGLNHLRNLQLLQDTFGEFQQPQQRPKEEEIQALTSLLGQEPNVQLSGLERLLQAKKDHTPITEDVSDFVNPQMQPNIKVEHSPSDYYAGGSLQGQVQPVFVTLAPQETTPKYVLEQEEDTKEQQPRQYASKYAFGYQIKDHHSGNHYGHQESREGRTAKGRYHVLLPDGRTQNVEYLADESGFHAKVTYDTVAYH